MKKILLFLITLIVLSEVRSQVVVPPGYSGFNSRNNWLAGAFNSLNVPAGDEPNLRIGQWVRAGAIYVDTTGGNKGLYYYRDGVFIRVVDTTMSTATGQRFGLDDISATGNRYFNFNNNDFEIDSAYNLTIDANNNLIINSPNLYFPGATFTPGADTAGYKIQVISMATGRSSYMNWVYAGVGGSSDTANLLVKRWGDVGVSIFGINNDTLLLKNAANGVFTIARSLNDSSHTFDFDSASASAKAWAEYYSAGGHGKTPGAVGVYNSSGAIDEDPATFFWDATDNELAIGHNNPTARLDIQDIANVQARITNTAGSGPGAGGFIAIGHNDGAAMASGDRLGTMAAAGAVSGSAMDNGGAIEFYANGNWSPTSIPTTAQMTLAPSGTTARSAFMTWLSNGNVGIGTSNQTPTARLQLPASTTTAGTASLKFNSGALPTTPETGIMAMQNGLWFIDSSTSIRDTIATREWARAAGLGTGGSGSSVIQYDTLITSGTTFTTPAGITTSTVFKIRLVGGGGGAAGVNSASQKSAGGGAAGALYVSVSGLSPSTAYTYAIGAAGAGGVGTASGTAGGNTTLTINGTTYTGNGGGGGPTGNPLNGGVGGTATNGEINITGQNGDGNPSTTSAAVASGRGGNPGFGFGIGGAGIGAANGNGLPATGYGGGGGAAWGTTATGGAGTQGAIFIEWLVGSGGGGSGSVTNVATGLGLSGGPITSTGTIIADTSYLVNKSTAQVISGAKNFTSASNKFSGLATDNTATKFVVAATDGTLGTQTIQTLSAYTSVDSLMSGQYTPTLANVTNVAGTTAVLVNYQKVGSIVHVQGVGSCTVTASGGTLTTMSITLPFASAMTLVTDCSGSGTARTSAAALPAYVATNTTTDVAEVSFYSGTGSHDVHFSFTYKVK